ncbi:MAG: DUF6152 family protein [Steroidobacteraceae bacterium]
MNRSIFRTLALVVSGAAGAALAHHSAAMYDASKTSELTGTIQRVQITNPHSWFWVRTSDSSGNQGALWSFEGGSANNVVRKLDGVDAKEYFAAGQKVKVSYHPLRDGRPSGELLTITFEDGRSFVAISGARVPSGPPPGNGQAPSQ